MFERPPDLVKEAMRTASNQDWRGFRPTTHRLVAGRFWESPLELIVRNVSGQEQKTQTTVGDAFLRFEGRQFDITRGGFETIIKADGCEFVVEGPGSNVRLLTILLEFERDGIDATSAQWFWYDTEWMDLGASAKGEFCSFFVVDKGKIVREEESFLLSWDAGFEWKDTTSTRFDPSIFEEIVPYEKSHEMAVQNRAAVKRTHWTVPEMIRRALNPFLWIGKLLGHGIFEIAQDVTYFSEGAWMDGKVRFWYRRFYADTQTGQMMVLRSEKPLHYYPEGRWRLDVEIGNLQARLAMIHLLLWVLVAASIFLVILLWK